MASISSTTSSSQSASLTVASTDLDFPKLKQAEESFATCSSSIASVSGTLPTRVSSVVAELQSSTFSLKNASVDRETRRLSRRIPLPPSLLTVETPRLDIEQRYQAALLEIQTIPNELNIPLENLAALIDSASQTSSVQELNKKLDEPMAPRSTAMEKARPVLQNIIAKIKNAIKEFEDQGSIDFLIEKLAEKHGVNEIKMRRFIIVAKGRLKQIAEKHQVDRHMLLQRAINPKAHSARLIQVIEIPVVSSAMQSLVTSSFSSPSTSMRLAPSIEADNKETPLPRMGLRFQTLARTQTSSLGRIRIALFKRLEGAIQALGENPTEEDFQKVADSSSYELETLKNYREALQELRKGEPYDQETNQLQKKITATAALYSIDAIYLNQLYQKPKK